MNYKLVLVAGLVTSIVGGVLGWGMGQIALRQKPSQLRTSLSAGYQDLYNRQFIWLGALTGGLIGMGQECVRQLKDEEDRRRDEESKG